MHVGRLKTRSPEVSLLDVDHVPRELLFPNTPTRLPESVPHPLSVRVLLDFKINNGCIQWCAELLLHRGLMASLAGILLLQGDGAPCIEWGW